MPPQKRKCDQSCTQVAVDEDGQNRYAALIATVVFIYHKIPRIFIVDGVVNPTGYHGHERATLLLRSARRIRH